MMKHFFKIGAMILFVVGATNSFAQVSRVEFGKNRVQFHRNFDEWSQYESENFTTYWYGEGRMIGQAAAMMAESDFEEIQKVLEHRLSFKPEIIVYVDVTDLKQSNIGSDETFVTTQGQVKVVGEKIFVYFDGNHQNLRKQVREGVATVFLNAMLFGTSLQEIVQNAVLLNLPEWYKQGLVAYIGEEWNTDLDNQMRDIFQNKRYKNFNRFAESEPRLAGHAFWNYIAQQFGKSNVSNLLYLTRINRSLEEGFQYVLGGSYEGIALSCMEYFKKRYENEVIPNVASELKFRNKRKLPLTHLKISPDGKRVCYVTNEIGKFKVYIQDVSTGKRSMIFSGGGRNPFQAADYNYPLVAWNPDNQRIAIVHEKRDIVYLTDYNFEKHAKTTEEFVREFQRINSIDYMNPRELVIAATMRGFSDIYTYNTVNRQYRRITNDLWDDAEPVFVNIRNKKGILFVSNRTVNRLETNKLDSVLPIAHYDIFYKNLEDTSKNLVRVTNTPTVNESQPAAIDMFFFSYLSDESGIANRQIGHLEDVFDYTKVTFYVKSGEPIAFAQGDKNMKYDSLKNVYSIVIDSVMTVMDTSKVDSIILKDIYKTIAIVKNNSNVDRNLVFQSTAPRVNKVAELFYKERTPHIRILPIQTDSALTPMFTEQWKMTQKMKGRDAKTNNPNQPKLETTIPEPPHNKTSTSGEPVKTPEPPKKDSVKLDIDNYSFQTEFDHTETPKTVQVIKDEAVTVTEIRMTSSGRDKKVWSTESSSISRNGESVTVTEAERKILFRQSRITPYRLKFRNDFITTTMDNSPLFGGLNSFSGSPEGFTTQPMGLLMKANFKDLLEDYQLEGGVRIPTSFNGAEYYLLFDDKKHQLDKRYALYHKATRYSFGGNNIADASKSRESVSLAQMEIRYPLDIFTSLRASGTLRFDRYTALATDSTTLRLPSITEQRFGIKLEYVFDNTLDAGVNIKNGTRYKITAEVIKKLQIDFVDKLQFNVNKGFMTVLGFDARHYARLDRHSIFAIRAAGSTSIGSEKILNYLGGTDNSLFQGFGTTVATPKGEYAYQVAAANLRGFSSNIRNGNSYALINSELRIPVMRYIFNRPMNSFWRNLQLVGFFDVGTAWHGASPFRKDNPLNTIVVAPGEPPIIVTVNYFKDPLVAGYGVGGRFLLFGYMVRVDRAWGIETRKIQDPMWHFSIGYDF
jgi:hypothetical protein